MLFVPFVLVSLLVPALAAPGVGIHHLAPIPVVTDPTFPAIRYY